MTTGTCSRCNGKGNINGLAHVENGKCFLCHGAGVVSARTVPAATRAQILVRIKDEIEYARTGADAHMRAAAEDCIANLCRELGDDNVTARAQRALAA